ncbi:hypothetical protein ACFL27_22375 [candidate division CSSED10-310 bacterium]|uniref:Glycosyltransferase RgtA/B/C/D-like domain-containing protein n=1 Tax=candidate division CSSED10-310 bacterium TaxID=2855610 RepID=A0ABV6Z3C6_UNCC1
MKRVFFYRLVPLNIFYLISYFMLSGGLGTSILSFVVIPLILFGPGFSFIRSPGEAYLSPVYRLFQGLCYSLGLNLVVTAGLIFLNISREPLSFLMIQACLTNLLIWITFFFHLQHHPESEATTFFSGNCTKITPYRLLGILFACLCFSVLFFLLVHTTGTLKLLWDHETYLIGASFGLMEELKPTTWPSLPDDTFRTTNLSKPTLTFFYTAWSILLSGLLPETEPFYRAAFIKETNRPMATQYWVDGEKTDFPRELITNAHGGNGRGVRLYIEPAIPISNKLLFVARIPHAFSLWLSSIVLLLLFRKLQVGVPFQILGVLFYLSMPEILIRGSSASTDPISYLLFIFLIYFFFDEDCAQTNTRNCFLFTASLLLYWSHQKTVVFALALCCWRFAKEDSFKKIITDFCLLGYLAGFVTFMVYSLWCDPLDFYHAFLGEQNVNRFDLFTTLAPEDRVYPDVPHLWSQFNHFLGNPFLYIALFTLLLSGLKYKEKQSIFLYWFVVTALLGSLMDWRMTRHLTVGILPLFIPYIMVSDRWSWQWKCGSGAVLSLIFFMNCHLSWTILTDFTAHSPLPAW